METSREQRTARDVSLSPECFSPQIRHLEAYSEDHEREHLYQQCHEAPFLSTLTPAVPAEYLATSSLRSSRRTSSSSSSSSHADEEEEDDTDEHSVSTPNVSAPSSEANCEVFYPAVSHAAGGSRHYSEDTLVEQDSEDRVQASSLAQDSHALSEHVHDSYSKRAGAVEDAEDRRSGSFPSQEDMPPEDEQSIQSTKAERAGARYNEGDADAVHTCSSSVEGVATSTACVSGRVSPPSLVSCTSHADTCSNGRPCLVDTSVACCGLQGDRPLPDASFTSASLLGDSRSSGPDAHAATCDAAEHSIYLQSYAFNQDNTCFLCATTAGFRVFTCAPLFEFMRRESTAWGEGCYEVAGMLFRTNVFALVSAAEQKKVKLWDDQKKIFIGELRSRQPIKNVCLGREILAVVTEYTVYVYQSEQMRPFSIIHTGPNPRGLCIIASTRDEDGWILACPAVAAGAVRVQTPDGDKTSHVFQAHQTPLAVMAFNSRGTWIATASETGTVIRIFCSLGGQLLHELRRGTHSYAVSCLALRADDLFLAVASSSPTVHIFKLEVHERSQQRHCSDPRNLGTAEETLGTVLTDGSSCDVQAPARIRPTAENFYRCESASSAATTVSSTSSVSGGCSITSGNSARAPTTAVPLQQALAVGKELTSVVYDASKEIVNDVIKGVLFKYFSAVRSFAQFHVPVDQQAIDVRSPTSRILGPLCAFAGEISNHLYLLHPNGMFYEFRFDPNYGDECTLLTATPWFAPRPDFQIQSHLVLPAFPSELEGGHEGDEWQIVM